MEIKPGDIVTYYGCSEGGETVDYIDDHYLGIYVVTECYDVDYDQDGGSVIGGMSPIEDIETENGEAYENH